MQNKLLIFFASFSLAFSVHSIEQCGKGVIKFTYKNQEKQIDEVFCYDEDRFDQYIYSKDCSSLACKELVNPAARPISLRSYPSTVGSPGFKICRELGGSPQIIEFQFKSTDWHQSSRCIFSNNTFVSNNLLIKLWKPYILY